MRIFVDLHTHTHHSLDAKYSPAEMAKAAKARGLDAIAVCDHNEWGIFDDPIQDYDVLILPCVEYSTTAGHIIGLFMKKPPLLTPCDQHYYDPADVVEGIHKEGGLAVAAHPFPSEKRENGERRISLADGVEIFNCRAMATRRASLPDALSAAGDRFYTAGSDSHSPRELGGVRLALEVAELTAVAIREALLRRDGQLVGYPGAMVDKARADYKKAKTRLRKMRACCKILGYFLWDFLRLPIMNREYAVDFASGSYTKQRKRRRLCQ